MCVAALAEGDEVCGVVVGGVAIDMVNVEVLAAAADSAPAAFTVEDPVAQAFPCAEGVLLLRVILTENRVQRGSRHRARCAVN